MNEVSKNLKKCWVKYTFFDQRQIDNLPINPLLCLELVKKVVEVGWTVFKPILVFSFILSLSIQPCSYDSIILVITQGSIVLRQYMVQSIVKVSFWHSALFWLPCFSQLSTCRTRLCQTSYRPLDLRGS